YVVSTDPPAVVGIQAEPVEGAGFGGNLPALHADSCLEVSGWRRVMDSLPGSARQRSKHRELGEGRQRSKEDHGGEIGALKPLRLVGCAIGHPVSLDTRLG